MKLITLNTHSLAEPDYENKLKLFAQEVLRQKPDVIALQEVNQSVDREPVEAGRLEGSGFVRCREMAGGQERREAVQGAAGDQERREREASGGRAGVGPVEAESGNCGGQREPDAGSCGGVIPVRADNHAFRLAELLAEGGMPCFWTWVPAKIGYGKYDEGTALFSRRPITEAGWIYLTDTRDYNNWKTRKALEIRAEIAGNCCRFFSLHMGWWQDDDEPFARQWRRLTGHLESGAGGLCFLMGDFNAPAGIQGEGYELVKGSGWLDTYELAARRDSGITVGQAIDGWRDGAPAEGMRIDFIWANREIAVSRSQVICNGVYGPVVSDHSGVMIECEPGTVPGRGERAR